jgi:hypothetical protein
VGACGTIIQVEHESLRNISDGFLSLTEAYIIPKISVVLISLASHPGLAVAGLDGHAGDFGTKMNRIFARLDSVAANQCPLTPSCSEAL